MPEKKLICVSCGKEFTFYEEEQRWYLSKGYAPPKRCKPCRVARREQDKKNARSAKTPR